MGIPSPSCSLNSTVLLCDGREHLGGFLSSEKGKLHSSHKTQMKQTILRKDLFIFNLSSCTTSDADMPLTCSSHFNVNYIRIHCIAVQSNLHLFPDFVFPPSISI